MYAEVHALFLFMKTPNLTQEQVKEMYHILMEIYDGLKDKNTNIGPNKIALYEKVWMYGIEELLDKINENDIPALQDSG